MRRTCVLSIGVVVSFLLGLVWAASPPLLQAGFSVGAQLAPAITVSQACALGGTSLAIVQGSKLKGIDPSLYPVLLVVTCLDSPNQLKFVDPATGTVLKTIPTNGVSGNLAQFVNRPDKGNLLSCSDNGSLYSIVYSQFDVTAQVKDPTGTAPTLTPINGSLAKVQHNVRYTYITPEGETLPSNRALITPSTKSGGIRVTAGALPPRATGIAVYIGRTDVAGGIETKQGTSSTNVYDRTTALVTGAALPTANSTGTPGSTTVVPRPANLPTNCGALTWDPEQDTIYQGFTTGSSAIAVRSFKDQPNPTVLATYDVGSAACTPTGLAVTGGVLVVTCKETNQAPSKILRLDKTTGVTLSLNGTVTLSGLTIPGLRGLACDPVSFQFDANRKDQFKDAMWSRSPDGTQLVALEFPAFTCGLPSNATVLTPGLSSPSCFDAVTGRVKDENDDGLPDCWEDATLWPQDSKPGIDFDGDGVRDFKLCVMVDPDGGGIADTEECADTNSKHVFVEIDYMEHHKPNPSALSQPEGGTVTSVREAFRVAPVSGNPLALGGPFPGIKIHFQVDEQVPHSTYLVFTPCTGPIGFSPDQSQTADFDDLKKTYFGTAADRAANVANPNVLNARRLAVRYMVFAHNQVGSTPLSGSSSSGCSEVAGDDTTTTLGSFTQTTETENGVSVLHNRGNRDEQAGTVMHEVGHNLGLRHGGHDNVNCKPNYLSVMKYNGQFPGKPIPAADWKLDYSRAQLGDLDKSNLTETPGLVDDPLHPGSLAGNKTSFGPSTWTVVAADAATIDWNKSAATPSSADINAGPLSGCDANTPPLPPTPPNTTAMLEGFDDWRNLIYRFSAALDFAGGSDHSSAHGHVDIDPTQANELFLAADLDGNNVGDASDCGTFSTGGFPPYTCTHRIDIKPSSIADASGAKIISLGADATISIAMFSELCTSSTPPALQCPNQPVLGNGLWDATVQVIISCQGIIGCVTSQHLPIFHVESENIPMKVNANGSGTCSARDVADPKTGKKDGKKDLVCGFDTNGLAVGSYTGYVTGYFKDPNSPNPNFTDPNALPPAFQAKQDFIVVP